MNRNPDGIILTAGYSSRMSLFKPLCPVGSEILIDRVVRILKEGGVERIFAVTGHRAELLTERLREQNVVPLFNSAYDDGMYTSVTTAVENLPGDSPGFFMLPVDYPFVLPETIRRLREAFSEGEADVIHPVFGGKKGHPPLIRASLYRRILDYSGENGLGGLLRGEGITHAYIEAGDEGILFDADTDEALEGLLKQFGDRVR